MIISVAMTTYNGSKYIIEQLDSIKNQTFPPDEVIICDDSSTDNTAHLVINYLSENHLDNWKFSVNKQRLGWRENFRKAISITKGEIVFFSDQDDLWSIDKIEIMSNLMLRYNMGCLYAESEKIDAQGNIINKHIAEDYFTGRLEQILFSPSFYAVGGLGCCMCVRRRIITKYIDLNIREDDHDSQCPRIAVFYDSLWKLDKPLIKYRIHDNNTSNVSKGCAFGTTSLEYRIKCIKVIIKWLEAIRQDKNVDQIHSEYINGAYRLENCRLKYLEENNTFFFSLLQHYKYYSNVTMLVGDFAYKHGLNQIFGQVRWNLDGFFYIFKTFFKVRD